MFLALARSPTSLPISPAPLTLGRSWESLSDFSVVKALTRVLPVTSSITWARMWWREKFTARRGRSVVPLTLRRTRTWVRMREALEVSLAIGVSLLALGGLAFLADDLFAGVADAFAFVGFGRIIAADVGGDGADFLLVRTLDEDVGVVGHGHFDVVGHRVGDGVGESEFEAEVLALKRGLEADALDFELLLGAFVGALDKIGQEGARKSMERRVLAGGPFFLDEKGLAVKARFDAGRQGVVELAARSLDVDERPLHGDFHLVGNVNGFLSDA